MSASRMRASLRLFGGRVALIAATTAGLIAASLALSPAALAAGGLVGTVTVTAPATADEGDTVTVAIPVDTVADLYAYDLTVTYDPALLEFDPASATLPAGGHSSLADAGGTIHLTHTRLGTSPGLDGPQTLATLTFTALGGGTATVQLADATFIDSLGTATPIAAPVGTEIALTAAPVTEPSPTASDSASPSPSASAALAVSGDSNPLASTGSTLVVPLIAGALAVALLALGTVLVIRRRKEALR